MSLLTAKASTTEEPREGKLHAGICAGGVGSTGVPTVTAQKQLQDIKEISYGSMVTRTLRQ